MTLGPKLKQRLDCLKIEANFANALAMEEKNVNLLDVACHEVLDNKNLVEFLVDIIRPFGNELNKGTRNAGAQGIKISGLMKLGQTKTADGKMTSLQYIVSVVGQHRPHLLQLGIQFKACKDAIRLEFKNIDMALSALKKDIGTITTVLTASKAATPPDEPMLLRFEPFLAAVKVKFEELEERYKAAKGEAMDGARSAVGSDSVCVWEAVDSAHAMSSRPIMLSLLVRAAHL